MASESRGPAHATSDDAATALRDALVSSLDKILDRLPPHLRAEWGGKDEEDPYAYPSPRAGLWQSQSRYERRPPLSGMHIQACACTQAYLRLGERPFLTSTDLN